MKSSKIRVELARIAAKHNGRLRPEDVVKEAASAASPLHSQFDWEDSEAAHRWRLHQARNLINVVVDYIGPKESTEPDRVFVSLVGDRQHGGGYRTLVSILSDSELRRQLLADALAEMETFQKKYARLKELSRVFSAMRIVGRKHRKRHAG